VGNSGPHALVIGLPGGTNSSTENQSLQTSSVRLSARPSNADSMSSHRRTGIELLARPQGRAGGRVEPAGVFGGTSAGERVPRVS